MTTDGPAVLVVDDESAVRSALAAMLVHHGYRPLAVCGEAEAAGVLRADGRCVAAVVDRPAALDAVRLARPGLPCVLLTGNPNQYDHADLHARGAVDVLAKPVELERLGAVVAAITRRG